MDHQVERAYLSAGAHDLCVDTICSDRFDSMVEEITIVVEQFAERNVEVIPGRLGLWRAIGFNRDVSEDEVLAWFNGQDADAMLAAMHRLPLTAGDTLLVPAGVPHAIGPGLTLVELQQPTDLSILLEYAGFDGLSADAATLGLDPGTAFAALDRHRWESGELDTLTASPRPVRDGVMRLFASAADPYFRAERLHVDGALRLDAGYSILVATAGSVRLVHRNGALPVDEGDVILVPYGLGEFELIGSGTLLRCRPPAA